jgi:hypothetical protein
MRSDHPAEAAFSAAASGAVGSGLGHRLYPVPLRLPPCPPKARKSNLMDLLPASGAAAAYAVAVVP